MDILRPRPDGPSAQVSGKAGALQRLGYDEVGGELNLVRKLVGGQRFDLYRQRGTLGKRLDGGAQSALGQHGGVDAAGQLAQLVERLARTRS
jgi:hypothetical protein